MKKHAWAAGFTACLTAFTVFLSLDTFALSSAYQTDATQMNTAMIRQVEADSVTAATVEGGRKSRKKEDTSDSSSSSDGSADGAGSSVDGSDSGSTGGESSGQPRKKKSPGGKAGFRSSGGSPSVSGSGGSSSASGSGDSSSVSGSGGSPSVSGSGGRSSAGGSGKGRSRSSSSFDAEAAAEEAAAVTTDNAGTTDTYQDDNVTIKYTEYTTNGTTIHVADVQLSSIEYLKTAFAQDTYGKNVTESTSDMAASHNAILAVNGDYYGVQERGYVIRNGIVYRDEAGTSDVLCIYGDGSMKVVDPSAVTAQELVDQGVWQAFSFGPGLLEDGEIAVDLDSEVGRAKASNPRTAIGMIDPLHYVFVVSDGRSDESEGLSLYELATFMDQLGVQTAYNLDGGGSSTMVFQGEVINDPSGGFGDREREVSDIVYIG